MDPFGYLVKCNAPARGSHCWGGGGIACSFSLLNSFSHRPSKPRPIKRATIFQPKHFTPRHPSAPIDQTNWGNCSERQFLKRWPIFLEYTRKVKNMSYSDELIREFIDTITSSLKMCIGNAKRCVFTADRQSNSRDLRSNLLQ